MKSQKSEGELEETLLRHLGGFGEGTESSRAWECPPLWTPIPGSASLGRASLPVKTGSDHPELFLR